MGMKVELPNRVRKGTKDLVQIEALVTPVSWIAVAYWTGGTLGDLWQKQLEFYKFVVENQGK